MVTLTSHGNLITSFTNNTINLINQQATTAAWPLWRTWWTEQFPWPRRKTDHQDFMSPLKFSKVVLSELWSEPQPWTTQCNKDPGVPTCCWPHWVHISTFIINQVDQEALYPGNDGVWLWRYLHFFLRFLLFFVVFLFVCFDANCLPS